MPYVSDVYNVMIASPSDVTEEREIARQIILDWNNINTFSRKIVLLPIGWEYNVVPTMGDRPQQIVNNQILKNADLLIGIFWTRIGTPTGAAVSGSAEEIEEHIISNKPAMLYFSNKPVVPSSIDDLQYDAVKKLQKEYQSKGITEHFSSIEEFKDKFQRHLAMKLNSNDYFKNSVSNKSNQSSGKTNKKLNISEKLSTEARNLLLEASLDSSGQIIRIGYSGGFEIITNSKQFVNHEDHRSKALWVSALEELEGNLLVHSVGSKGEIFEMTKFGYDVSETLRAEL